jgi:4-hydroxybenzoate polyprenyltransferase
MLKLIVGALVILWLIGLLAHVAGGLIYILLIVAAIVFVYDTLLAHRR